MSESESVSLTAVFETAEVAGQLAMSITPAATHETTVEVEASLLFTSDVGPIGVSPITGSFLFSAGNRYRFDDYRPTVHSVEGLAIANAGAPPIWRSLNNPPLLANSYFSQVDPISFGLIQRERTFAAYQDDEKHYELSPSLIVEPLEHWGPGFIRLIEVPARSEGEPNIGAFWLPEQNWKAGEKATFRYSLRWDRSDRAPDRLARVVSLSAGRGGVSGVNNEDALRKFVVDFEGPALTPELLPPNQIDAFVSVSPGQVSHVAVSRLPSTGRFRLAIDAEVRTSDPVELRAYLIAGGVQLPETWLYQWRHP